MGNLMDLSAGTGFPKRVEIDEAAQAPGAR